MSISRARSQRKRMSPPEARMWNVLRRDPLAGGHFRRQVRFGRYYADFASHSLRLVIEIDGGAHFSVAAQRHDAARDAFFASQGYSVLRLTTTDVLADLDGTVRAVLSHFPQPVPAAPGHPPHKGEGWEEAANTAVNGATS